MIHPLSGRISIAPAWFAVAASLASLAATLAASACALPRKESAPGGGQLRVRVLAGEQALQTFVATGIRLGPRPALATMVLPKTRRSGRRRTSKGGARSSTLPASGSSSASTR